MATLKNFNYPVQAGVSAQVKAKINKVEFDGYQQRTKKGIHNLLRKFSVKYVGSYFEKNGQIITDGNSLEVENFLKAHEGYKAFNWTSYLAPNNKAIKVYCPSWSVKYNKGTVEISMNFEEVLA